MNSNKQSELDRTQNQVTFKEANARIQRQVVKILPTRDKNVFSVGFTCECSRESCREQIELTIEQYHQLINNNRQFVLKPFHYETDLEKVVERHTAYDIVEKYKVPPPSNGVLNQTISSGSRAEPYKEGRSGQ